MLILNNPSRTLTHLVASAQSKDSLTILSTADHPVADPNGSHLEYSAWPMGTSYQDGWYWSQPQGHVENTMAKPLITGP